MLATSIVVTLQAFGCAERMPAITDPRIYVGAEACQLGDFIVLSTNGDLSCRDYVPNLSYDTCAEYLHPSHDKVINVFDPMTQPMEQRTAAAIAITPNPYMTAQDAHIAVVTNSVDASANFPAKVDVGINVTTLDFVVSLVTGKVTLTQAQLACLRSQQTMDLKQLALHDGQAVAGIVDEAWLGYAQIVRAHSAELEAKTPPTPGTPVMVAITASNFSLQTDIRGSIKESYVSSLESLLKNLEGADATVAATKLAREIVNVVRPVTIFVACEPLPSAPGDGC